MKAADVRAMSADQLNDELAKLKKEQFNLRFQKATGQLEKSSRVNEVRKDIARVKTIARQKAAEERQDRSGPRRASFCPSAASEDRSSVQEVQGA